MLVGPIVTVLLVAVPGLARAGDPNAAPPAGDDYPWTATFEVGLGFNLLDGTPFAEALDDFGYTFDAGGWSLLVAVDRSASSWLHVGGAVTASSFAGGRDRADTEMSLTRITARVHARASLCMVNRCTRDEAAEFGFQLAAGGGLTMWGLRDEVEAAPHLSLEASLQWSVLLGRWGFGLRIGHALLADGDLGPLALSTGVHWSPTLALQVYYRW